MRMIKWTRQILSLIVSSLLVLLLASCSTKTVAERYRSSLQEADYKTAESIFMDNTNEEVEAKLDLELASFILNQRRKLSAQEISSDDFTNLLNELANYRLTHDTSLIDAAVSLQSERVDASEMIGQARNASQLSDWPEAMRLLGEAKAYAMSTASVRELYSTVRLNYKQDIAARVKTLESKGNMQAARDLLIEAVSFIPNDNDLALELSRMEHLILSNEQKTLIQNVQNLRDEGAWQPSLDAIDAASEAVKQTTEVKALKEQIERSYEDALLTALDNLEAAEEHEAALEQVKKDLEIFPDSLRLKWKQSVYEALVAREKENK